MGLQDYKIFVIIFIDEFSDLSKKKIEILNFWNVEDFLSLEREFVKVLVSFFGVVWSNLIVFCVLVRVIIFLNKRFD